MVTPVNLLGCGSYRVFIQERGGAHYTCELLDTISIRFSRVLNEISDAEIEVSMRCCGPLSSVNPWQHEVAIFRNDEQVWVGPIIDLEFNASDEKITVYAKDLLTWADRRLVELANVDYDTESTDLADAYVWLLEHAYCKDPWGMTWGIDPTGIPVQRFYPSFDKAAGDRWGGGYVACGEDMRTLSESGIDFTVINRHLWGGSLEIISPGSSGVVLLDQHFKTTPTVKVTGSKYTNRAVSAGGQGGMMGFYDDQIAIYPATIGPITPTLLDSVQQQYGLVETFLTTDILDDVDTTVTPNPVAQDAKTRWDLLHLPYTYVTDGTLSPSAPIVFNQDLIPGSTFVLILNSVCRPLSEPSVRLREVRVSVTGKDEEVSLNLTPLGTTTTQV